MASSSEEWKLLWNGTRNEDAANEAVALDSAPTLFLASFPELANTIRLDFAAPGPDNYVEIDAVMLIGASSTSIAKLSSQQVVFIQDSESDFYFNATEDHFTFTIDDSDYYMRYRELDISSATVTLHITPINDPPITENITIALATTEITVNLTVRDADGPSFPTVTIVELPQYGYVANISGMDVSQDEAVYFFFFLLPSQFHSCIALLLFTKLGNVVLLRICFRMLPVMENPFLLSLLYLYKLAMFHANHVHLLSTAPNICRYTNYSSIFFPVSHFFCDFSLCGCFDLTVCMAYTSTTQNLPFYNKW